MKSSQNTPAPATEGAQREAVALELAPIEPKPACWIDGADIGHLADGAVEHVYAYAKQILPCMVPVFARPPPPDRAQTRNPESSIAQPERVEADCTCPNCGAPTTREWRDVPGQTGSPPGYFQHTYAAPPTDASGGVTEADIAFLRDVANWLAKESKGTNPSYELRNGFLDAAANAVSRAADRARKPDTRRVASGEICHCTCHNDPLYCRECKECSCHAK